MWQPQQLVPLPLPRKLASQQPFGEVLGDTDGRVALTEACAAAHLLRCLYLASHSNTAKLGCLQNWWNLKPVLSVLPAPNPALVEFVGLT